MAERKDRMALLGTYSSQHLKRYGAKPLLNLNTEQWAADACRVIGLLDLLSMRLVYYYFEVAQNPSWTFFAYNAEKILQAMDEKAKDQRERAERREMAKRWLSE
jgi:hypothetical protein